MIVKLFLSCTMISMKGRKKTAQEVALIQLEKQGAITQYRFLGLLVQYVKILDLINSDKTCFNLKIIYNLKDLNKKQMLSVKIIITYPLTFL